MRTGRRSASTIWSIDARRGSPAGFGFFGFTARPARLTGGFRYLRFHGATGKYHGRYGRDALRPFASDLRRWTSDGRDAWVFFNNDLGGHALEDARDLEGLLGGGTSLAIP